MARAQTHYNLKKSAPGDVDDNDDDGTTLQH